MGRQLVCLPDELLILIMAFLPPPRSLIACQRSCLRVYAIIEQSRLLRHRILIEEDLSPPALSISDFFQDLRE